MAIEILRGAADLQNVGLTILLAVGLLSVMNIQFKKGLKRYQSASS